MNVIRAGRKGTVRGGNGVALVTFTCGDATTIAVTLSPNQTIEVVAGSGDVTFEVCNHPERAAKLRAVSNSANDDMPGDALDSTNP